MRRGFMCQLVLVIFLHCCTTSGAHCALRMLRRVLTGPCLLMRGPLTRRWGCVAFQPDTHNPKSAGQKPCPEPLHPKVSESSSPLHPKPSTLSPNLKPSALSLNPAKLKTRNSQNPQTSRPQKASAIIVSLELQTRDTSPCWKASA